MLPSRSAVVVAVAACLLLLPSVSGAQVDSGDRILEDLGLGDLGLEQRVGQMVFPRLPGTLLSEDDPAFREVASLAAAGTIGGVILFGGDPLSAASTASRLQEVSDVPLLFGLDAEWGTGMRFEGGLAFPVAMAMGAADDAALVEEVGRWTAREAVRAGIHLVLAPVLDLAVEPDNRVIGFRSFGSDPERVGQLGAAFVRGVQEEGALAVAKHFPGHGATVEDSHYALPHLAVSLDTLTARELVPFVRVVEAGIAGVMPAHLVVEALDGGEDLPASRSPAVLGGLLRQRLGFDGLIVSDALDMAGARGDWHGSVVVDAVKAGTDLLLLPPQPRVAVDALVRAVRTGEIPVERIDRSVARILEAKRRVGLFGEQRPAPLVEDRAAARALQGSLARAAVTWLATAAGAAAEGEGVPGDCLGGGRGGAPCWEGDVLVVSLVDEFDRDSAPGTLAAAMRRRSGSVEDLWVRPSSVADRSERILESVGEADALLVASFATRRSWGPVRDGEGRLAGEWATVGQWIAAARSRGIPVVHAALADPWTLRLEAPARLGVFDRSPASQVALVEAIHGEIPVSGRMPVALEDDGPTLARTWDRPSWSAQPIDDPRDVGMSRRTDQRLRRVLREAVDDGAFPGAVALVARHGRVVFHEAVGRLTRDDDAAQVTRDTLYDLASLTKVVVTTTLTMILEERGLVDLDAPVQRYLPEFTGPGKEEVAVVDLLTHASGALWWTDLYARHGRRGEPGAAADAYLGEIFALPLEHAPRSETVYSDLGILMMGEILERVTGRDLDDLARNEIFRPLGMDATGYRPTEPPLSAPLARIAPTEQDPWRGEIVRGEVHDENAAGLGGVAAHAGLFATAADLGRFLQMLVDGGHLDGVRLLRPSTIERFVQRAERVPGSSRAIGWDTPSGRSSAGDYFSAESYGHTGFTGTSLWVDPRHDVFAVLLTNRVHPTRENRRISGVRRDFHDAVMRSVEDEDVPLRPGAGEGDEP